MKLRIRGDSIRLRLTRGEVRQLLDAGSVVEETRFPSGPSIRYELRAGPAAAVSAGFESGAVIVTVPAAVAAAWATSDEEAIRAQLAIPDGTLLILVEKDFPCGTDRPFEDDRDAFRRDRLSVER